MNKTQHVQPLQSKITIREFLERDRGYGAYALGDLEEPHWAACEFFGVKVPDNTSEKPQSLVLRYFGFETPLLVLFGKSAGVEATLAEILDERDVYFTASDALYPLLAPYYNLPDSQYMWRMVFNNEAALQPFAKQPDARPLRGDEGVNLLETFFASIEWDASNHFSPSQVADDAFCGVFKDGQLVSVAGTHLVSERESVAAIGNIYTLPDYRGRGLATLCTAQTTRQLLERGIQTIVLNVAQSNEPAIHIYEQLGYTRHKPFWEGMGYRKSSS